MNLYRKHHSTAEGLSLNHSYVLLQSKSLGIFELNRIFKIKASSYLLEIAKMQFFFFLNQQCYKLWLNFKLVADLQNKSLLFSYCASLVQQ